MPQCKDHALPPCQKNTPIANASDTGPGFSLLDFPGMLAKRSVVYFSIISSSPADFEAARTYLKELCSNSILVLVGVNLPHAKALHAWFSSQLEPEDRRFWYHDAETDTLYASDGTVITSENYKTVIACEVR